MTTRPTPEETVALAQTQHLDPRDFSQCQRDRLRAGVESMAARLAELEQRYTAACTYADEASRLKRENEAIQLRIQSLENTIDTLCHLSRETWIVLSDDPVGDPSDLPHKARNVMQDAQEKMEAMNDQLRLSLITAENALHDEREAHAATDDKLGDIETRLRAAQAELANMELRKDDAYTERNRVVALLAACFPAVRTRTAIEGWSPDWHGCVYIVLPTGQVSWHYHDSHAQLFEHVREGVMEWDGHSIPDKYRRVKEAIAWVELLYHEGAVREACLEELRGIYISIKCQEETRNLWDIVGDRIAELEAEGDTHAQ